MQKASIQKQATSASSFARRLLARARGGGRQPLAVVLSGGGALGALQAGFIDALAQRGIRPDLIVGTSVGAINGAYWGLNPDPDAGRRLLAIWSRARRESFLPGGRLQMLRNLVGNRDHLFPSQFLTHLLTVHTPPEARIEDLPVPLAVTVCDALTGERLVLREGSLRQAILASAAIPGVFPPVRAQGRLCLDGGVVANCDLEAVREAGIRQAIAVDLSGLQPAAVPLGVMDVASRAVVFTVRRQTDLTLATLRNQISTVLVRPIVSGQPQLGDFSRTAELFELGQRFGEHLIAHHIDAAGNVLPGHLHRLSRGEDSDEISAEDDSTGIAS